MASNSTVNCFTIVRCTQNVRGDGNSFAWHQFYHHKRSKYTTSVDIQTSSVKASHSLGEVGAGERVGGENVRVRQRFVNVFIYLFILNVAS